MSNLPQHITVNLKLLLVIVMIFVAAFLLFSVMLVDRFHETRQLNDPPAIEQTHNFGL